MHVVRNIALRFRSSLGIPPPTRTEASAFDLHGLNEAQFWKLQIALRHSILKCAVICTKAFMASYRGPFSIPPALRVVLYVC